MNQISQIAKLPEVVAAVLSEPSGALLEWSGNINGEAAGAINAYAVQALRHTSELLGLGDFQRATIVGSTRTCVVTIHDGAVLGAYVEGHKTLGPFEKKLQDTLQK